MNILEKIALHKRQEIQALTDQTSWKELEQALGFKRSAFSLKEAMNSSKTGIITEFKRRSPSKPDINVNAQVEKVVPAYDNGGATGISILTDSHFFGGSNLDLQQGRDLTDLPLLRKDFILDEIQILETKAIGADVLLLIAAILTPKQIRQFTRTAKDLGLEVLLEVHTMEELLDNLHPDIDLVGVNNRNLKTFEVDLENSLRIIEEIPPEFPKIAESGLKEVTVVRALRQQGFNGFLMGENFMKTEDPGAAAAEFIQQLS